MEQSAFNLKFNYLKKKKFPMSYSIIYGRWLNTSNLSFKHYSHNSIIHLDLGLTKMIYQFIHQWRKMLVIPLRHQSFRSVEVVEVYLNKLKIILDILICFAAYLYGQMNQRCNLWQVHKKYRRNHCADGRYNIRIFGSFS